MRRTPFFLDHEVAGGRLVEFAGFELPIQYSGINAEHERVRSAVGLFDVSHMGEVVVRGPKALAAVQHLVSNDVSTIQDGQAQYTVMCNERGGIVDDLVVYRFAEDHFLICVNAANRDKDFAWMQAHNAFPGEAVFTDEGDEWAQVALQGRFAEQTLARVCDIPLASIETYHFARGVVAGIEGCIVARTGYTGEDGFEVFAPAATARPLWGALMEAGGPDGILPIGLGARDTLRLEVRYPLYGNELTDDTTPLQAGLGWVTKLEKGDFVGRDALLAAKGSATHRLVGLTVQNKRIPRSGMRILRDGEDVGYVTSGTRSPSIKRGIALAYLRRDAIRPNTEVTIDVRGREAPAVVTRGAFYKRDY